MVLTPVIMAKEEEKASCCRKNGVKAIEYWQEIGVGWSTGNWKKLKCCLLCPPESDKSAGRKLDLGQKLP